MISDKFSPMAENMRYYWALLACPGVWVESEGAVALMLSLKWGSAVKE